MGVIICLLAASTLIILICLVVLSVILSKLNRIVDNTSAGRVAPMQTVSVDSLREVPDGTSPTQEKPVQAAPKENEQYFIPDRQKIIAAVTAAIAEDLGMDVSCLRVLSFRQVSVPTKTFIPNRRELIAAVTAAIAEDLGTDISGLRVLSFRQV